MTTAEDPDFDASRVMQNPGQTFVPEEDPNAIFVNGQPDRVRRVYVLNGDKTVTLSPALYDAIVPLGKSLTIRWD